VPVPTPASAAITVKADSSDMDRGLRTRVAESLRSISAIRVGAQRKSALAELIGNAPPRAANAARRDRNVVA
jgi:hypothetical protein